MGKKNAGPVMLSGASQPQFVSIPEAASLLRISTVSIRRYLGQKRLKRYKCGSRTLIDRAELMGLVRVE